MLKVLLSTCLPEEEQNTRWYECKKSINRNARGCRYVPRHWRTSRICRHSSTLYQREEEKKGKRDKVTIYLLIPRHDYPQRDRAISHRTFPIASFLYTSMSFSSYSASRATSLTVSVWYTTTARNHINWSFQVSTNINPISGGRFSSLSAPGDELTNSTIIATKTTTVPICARVLLSNGKLPICELITTRDDEVPRLLVKAFDGRIKSPTRARFKDLSARRCNRNNPGIRESRFGKWS